MPKEVEKQYKAIINRYINTKSENDLYAGQKFSRRFIEKEISPEEVIGIHKSALMELFKRCARRLLAFFRFPHRNDDSLWTCTTRASKSYSQTRRT